MTNPADDLWAQRTAALASVAALEREVAQIIAASESSNADDEHDPEGTTIAFEREQARALLDAAQQRVADIDAALAHSRSGDYGICESCGEPIGAERLEARPAARTCITCASRRRSG